MQDLQGQQQTCVKADGNLLERIITRRMEAKRANMAVFRTTVYFFILAFIRFDMSFGTTVWRIQNFNYIVSYLVYFIEASLAFILVVELLRLLLKRYFWSPPIIELTPEQQKLFGVYDNEPGFRVVKFAPSVDGSHLVAGPRYSPSNYTSAGGQRSLFGLSQSPTSSVFSQSCGSSPGSFMSNQAAPLTGISPPCYGMNSPCASPGSPGSFGASPGTRHSPFYADPNSSFPGSPNYASRTGMPSYPHTPASAGLQKLSERTGMKTNTSPKLSPLRSEDCIRDPAALEQYLREQDEKQILKSAADVQQPGTGGLSTSSFWSYGRTVMDFLPSLHQFQYQLAPRSPVSASNPDDPRVEKNSPAGDDATSIWLRVGVDQDHLDRWCENLRKWLGSTILTRLVIEINEVNTLLIRVGSEDIRVGESSLTTLKQIAAVKSQYLAPLAALLPYIDLTPNQEYLIQRIRELASGGCMSSFKWNGGAEFKGKSWDETLPTDSLILIHLFCAYLDSRLPGNLKYPEGKTFTSQHFIVVPDKPNVVDKKENLAIYMTRLNPPHFQVVVEGTVANIKAGRHNLFHAILLFLYHIKVKEHGMLRRINLGMSGLNIMWVFEQ